MASAVKKKRTSSADVMVDDWLEEDGLVLLTGWSRDGYTYQDIANRIGIRPSMLTKWRKEHPEIEQALKEGREIVDYKVENALLKSALGFRTKEVEVTTILRNGKTIETQKRTLDKEVAPNVMAAQVWLYNRLPKKWKRNPGELLNVDDDDMNIQITVTRASANETDQDGVDDEWQETVNKQVQVRRATEEEVRQKKNQKKSESQNKEPMKTIVEDDEADDWGDEDDWDDWDGE